MTRETTDMSSDTFDDLRDLYQEVILDHGRRPRHAKRLESFDATAKGDNPMCGDRIEVWVKYAPDGTIADTGFQARGCAISVASADLMAETVVGRSKADAHALFEAFREIIHAGGQATRLLDQKANVLFEQPDDGTGSRPEVPRGELRRILLGSLPADTVRWGHKVAAVAPLGGGRHLLTFADGSTVTTDLLVGADGAWSKVRPLLSEAKPVYVGTTYIETYLFDSDNSHRASAETVGGGALFAAAPGKGIVAHREPDGVLHTYVALNRPEDWIARLDFSDPVTALAHVAEEFDGWAPELTALITDGDAAPVDRKSVV